MTNIARCEMAGYPQRPITNGVSNFYKTQLTEISGVDKFLGVIAGSRAKLTNESLARVLFGGIISYPGRHPYKCCDIDYVTELGIAVASINDNPATKAVVESIFGTMLALRLRANERSDPSRWSNTWHANMVQSPGLLSSAKILLVGVGDVGGLLDKKLHGFGCQDVYYLDSGKGRVHQGVKAKPLLSRWGSLESALPDIDIVSLQVPNGQSVLKAEHIALLKEGAIVVNTGSGDSIDEDLLIQKALEQKIRVGLDVYKHEREMPKEKRELLQRLSLFGKILWQHESFFCHETMMETEELLLAPLEDWIAGRIEQVFDSGRIVNPTVRNVIVK